MFYRIAVMFTGASIRDTVGDRSGVCGKESNRFATARPHPHAPLTRVRVCAAARFAPCYACGARRRAVLPASA